jgi:hypothetical protein
MVTPDTRTGHCVLKRSPAMRLEHRKIRNVTQARAHFKHNTFCVTHLGNNDIAVCHVTVLEYKLRMCRSLLSPKAWVRANSYWQSRGDQSRAILTTVCSPDLSSFRSKYGRRILNAEKNVCPKFSRLVL